MLPKYNCYDKYVVYRYTCSICGEFYIVGRTLRKFSVRHAEHLRAIVNKSRSSALYEHVKDKHNDVGDIEVFRVDFIAKLTNSRDTTFTEAKAITYFKPTINRKHELPCYTLPSQFDHRAFTISLTS